MMSSQAALPLSGNTLLKLPPINTWLPGDPVRLFGQVWILGCDATSVPMGDCDYIFSSMSIKYHWKLENGATVITDNYAVFIYSPFDAPYKQIGRISFAFNHGDLWFGAIGNAPEIRYDGSWVVCSPFDVWGAFDSKESSRLFLDKLER